MKKHPFISLLGKYIKYPLSLKIDLIKLSKYKQFKELGLKQFKPNYIYQNITKPATYKPELPRNQRAKLQTVKNQYYLSGH
jgi:hypothetical protein